jgi:alpha-soluble NSF attachment protein
VETNDVEAFTNAVVEFDSISKLDAWKTSILLKIKKGIKGGSGGTDGDNDDDNDDDDDDGGLL